MGLGKTNKRKGSDAERYYAKFFRDLGYGHCETSRFVSKKHDNAKIDLVYIPWNIQIKAGRQLGMNPGKELLIMQSAMQAMFPKGDEVFNKPSLLFHFEECGTGHKRTPEHEKAYMSLAQFNTYKESNPSLEYTYLKEYKYETTSEFKTIVGMTVETFKNEIILKLYSNANSDIPAGD